MSFSEPARMQKSSGDAIIILGCAVLFWIAATVSLVFLWQSRNAPILDMHGFRQTQTAISALWMCREGTIIPYQTPVFGHPWFIPYEFPLYQALAAGLACLGLPLDLSGRVVSYACFVLLLLPVRLTIKAFRLPAYLFFLFGALYLSSPAYLFWGRAFLIETTALFCCVTGALLLILAAKGRHWLAVLGATACLTLGALVKGTTYPQCVAFGLAMAALVLHRDETLTWRKRLAFLSLLLAASLVPVLATFLWVRFCDAIKQAGLMSAIHTSRGLKPWYTPNLHLFLENIRLFPERIFRELVGNVWVASLCLPLALVGGLRLFGLNVLLAGCFFLPMLLFTRVHVVHNYYQVANGVFLIAAVAVSLFALARTRLKLLVPVALTGCLAINYMFFHDHFYKIFHDTPTRADTRQVLDFASALSDASDTTGVVFVFGRDWSPEIPYYSGRKSVMFPYWLPRHILKAVLAEPAILTGPQPLQAILFCPNTTGGHLYYDRTVDAFLQKYAAADQTLPVDGCTLYLHTPSRSTP
uniref:Glycosyltransferase RgtA/B/C/D-like domain-containing protein n=1 Tax=Desulfovibrio sp. U5L TaxID=596152 RepID=I2Q7Q9_9BACT